MLIIRIGLTPTVSEDFHLRSSTPRPRPETDLEEARRLKVNPPMAKAYKRRSRCQALRRLQTSLTQSATSIVPRVPHLYAVCSHLSDAVDARCEKCRRPNQHQCLPRSRKDERCVRRLHKPAARNTLAVELCGSERIKHIFCRAMLRVADYAVRRGCTDTV